MALVAGMNLELPRHLLPQVHKGDAFAIVKGKLVGLRWNAWQRGRAIGRTSPRLNGSFLFWWTASIARRAIEHIFVATRADDAMPHAAVAQTDGPHHRHAKRGAEERFDVAVPLGGDPAARVAKTRAHFQIVIGNKVSGQIVALARPGNDGMVRWPGMMRLDRGNVWLHKKTSLAARLRPDHAKCAPAHGGFGKCEVSYYRGMSLRASHTIRIEMHQRNKGCYQKHPLLVYIEEFIVEIEC